MEIKIVKTPTQGYGEILTNERWCVNDYCFKDLNDWLKFITSMEEKGADILYLYDMSTIQENLIYNMKTQKFEVVQQFRVRAQFKTKQ